MDIIIIGPGFFTIRDKDNDIIEQSEYVPLLTRRADSIIIDCMTLLDINMNGDVASDGSYYCIPFSKDIRAVTYRNDDVGDIVLVFDNDRNVDYSEIGDINDFDSDIITRKGDDIIVIHYDNRTYSRPHIYGMLNIYKKII